MIRVEDIHSLTDFQRNTKDHITRLKKTHRPSVLTVNGHAEVVVLDPDTYQQMVDALERAAALEGVRRGLEAADAGRTMSLDEFKRRLGTRVSKQATR